MIVSIDGIVVELIENRIVFGSCSAFDVVADAVHANVGVHKLGAFLLCELLKIPFEFLVLRLSPAASENKYSSEADNS